MTFKSLQIIESLRFNLNSIEKSIYFGNRSGIYALASKYELSEANIYKTEIIFVGRTHSSGDDSLKTKKEKKLSMDKIIKKLSLRKSLKNGPIHKGVRDYQYIKDMDSDLTEWMIDNLLFSFVPCRTSDKKLNNAVSEIIFLLDPILNSTKDKKTTFSHISRELKRKCMEIKKIKSKKIVRI